MDRKFDSHAPIAGMETIDETALSVDKEEETAAEAKEEDLIAEEAEKCAQMMTIEEDTVAAENASTNIIGGCRFSSSDDAGKSTIFACWTSDLVGVGLQPDFVDCSAWW